MKVNLSPRIKSRMKGAMSLSWRFISNFMLAVAGAVSMALAKTIGMAIWIMLIFCAMFTAAQILVDAQSVKVKPPAK